MGLYQKIRTDSPVTLWSRSTGKSTRLTVDRSISRVVNGEELFVYIDNEGRVRAFSPDRRDFLLNRAQVAASPSSKLKEIQRWVFQPANAV
ncbi:hypothetical protein AZE42_10698 [Rhizopogon vesiculosus]|uniref:Uncharacterized protein n=1 Tax=Rhizopogon vesiculosus TaxID=180088 RepID=A0A1J8PGS7_9AGAM|nr:hypothetical protein AZE42_10698 [Rhizopogon vesiculosus]